MQPINLDICQKLLNQRLLQLDKLEVPSHAQLNKKSNTNKADAIQSEPQRIVTYYALRERRQIERALSRIKQGDYGWCKDCGHQIEVDRLQAEPSTELCTRCAHGGDH